MSKIELYLDQVYGEEYPDLTEEENGRLLF